MPEYNADGNVSMARRVQDYLKQQFEEATKAYEYHQNLMNDARQTLDACRSGLEHLEQDQPVPSQTYSTKHMSVLNG